jgi:hypothetical protein
MPTRISSAVMTWSFSLPGRFSVSSPFEVLHRAVGRPAGGPYTSQADVHPFVMREMGRSPMAARLAIDRN